MKFLLLIKKTAKLVSINVVILIILLTIIDPFLKDTSPSDYIERSVLLREYTPFTKEYHTPPGYYLDQTENLAEKAYQLRTDNNGFIIGENDSVKNSHADIIFFGGSTTECLYVEENKRFPYLVGEIIKENESGNNLTVLNAGTGGNCISHSIINLYAKGIPLSPKIVVIMHNINDLELLLKTGDYYKGPKYRTILIEEKTDELSLKMKVANICRSTADLFIPKISRIIKKSAERHSRNTSKADEWSNYRDKLFPYGTIESNYEKWLRSFVFSDKSQNIEVVLMTQFSRLDPDDDFIRAVYNEKQAEQENILAFDTLCTYYNNLNEKIRKIADKEQLLLIDLAKEVPSDSTYIYDMVHLNTHGSELVANIVAEQLQNTYYSSQN